MAVNTGALVAAAARRMNSLYYTTQSLMGIHDVWWYWLIGSRGRGKSYSVVETFLQFVDKYGQENVRCYYFRISDLSIQAMLANNAAKCIDAKLVRDYNLKLSVKAGVVYNHGKPMINFYPLVSAAKKGKGVAEYDPEFLDPSRRDRYIFIIIDEFMMAEGVEKRSIGNPVDQFKIYIENILRDQEQMPYTAVRIFGCANTVSECSDFLAQICGFVPQQLGRFILKRKHMVVDNIPNTEAYIEKRRKSIGADIMDYDNDENYTNVLKRDIESLKKKNQRLRKPTAIIKFSKKTYTWFTVWDGTIIKKYTGQSYRRDQVIAMVRYLDENYDLNLVNSVIERYDVRAWRYNDLISMATFAAYLKQIKAK